MGWSLDHLGRPSGREVGRSDAARLVTALLAPLDVDLFYYQHRGFLPNESAAVCVSSYPALDET